MKQSHTDTSSLNNFTHMDSIGRIGNNSGLGLSTGNSTQQASDRVITVSFEQLQNGMQRTYSAGTHDVVVRHEVRQ